MNKSEIERKKRLQLMGSIVPNSSINNLGISTTFILMEIHYIMR